MLREGLERPVQAMCSQDDFQEYALEDPGAAVYNGAASVNTIQ